MPSKYCADFETNNFVDDCRVWLWGVSEISSLKFYHGTTIDTFFEFMISNPGTYYFHNLKFDGNFIISFLLKHNFDYKPKYLTANTFSTIISDMGVFYKITIKTANKDTIQIMDSLKIINKSVSQIAKAFNLPEPKGDIPYDIRRPQNYQPNSNEIDYVRRDTSIVAQGLKYFFDQNLNKMTQGSNAYSDFKATLPGPFRKYFPILPYDDELRQAYKGGYCIVGPKFKNRNVGKGIVYDKNSMYPSHMYSDLLPYGTPKLYDGKYINDPNYPIYIQMISCQFELKDNMLPTIQLKNSRYGFNPVEYLTSSNYETITLTLTNLDLELFLSHYNVYNIEFHKGWKFKASKNIFKNFINKWYQIKLDATKEKNYPMREIAKVMLNSCYGKFGTNPIKGSKYPILDGNIVKYINNEPEVQDPEYIPMAAFITAYSRYDIISLGQKLYDRLLYIDTDSLHLLGEEPPDCLEINDFKLGAWKQENTFNRAKYLRAKTYLEECDNDLIIKCSGMPATLHDKVTWDNFKVGLTLEGKLKPKTVENGVVLVNTPFTLK